MFCFPAIFCASANPASSRVFEVGLGFAFERIEDAVAAANAWDTIFVHPLPDGAPYEKVAVLMRKPGITIKATGDASGQVRIAGEGFDYSGVGAVPRAVFQFNPEASYCTLEGFKVSGARNSSGNGAGVRINGANIVTIRNCEIHGCDMGVMSNGILGSPHEGAGVYQVYERLNVHHNGSPLKDGYSHNFYLGGWSAAIRHCEVHHSLSGHNIKARTKLVKIEDSYIHNSANREIDIVDSEESTQSDSNAEIDRCLIVKDPNCLGNREVIHFGQDMGGKRNGLLIIYQSAIVSPFITPVIRLSSFGERALISQSTIWDGGAGTPGQTLLYSASGSDLLNTASYKLVLSGGFTEGMPVIKAICAPQDKDRYLEPGEILELINPLDESVVFKGYSAEG